MNKLELLNYYLNLENHNGLCFERGTAERAECFERVGLIEEMIKTLQTKSAHFLPLEDGTDYEIPADVFSEYKALYPTLDIGFEFKRMRTWLAANPTKKKKRIGILRFINTWLSYEAKAVNKTADNKSKTNDKPSFLNNFNQDMPDLSKITDELVRRQKGAV